MKDISMMNQVIIIPSWYDNIRAHYGYIYHWLAQFCGYITQHFGYKVPIWGDDHPPKSCESKRKTTRNELVEISSKILMGFLYEII